MRGWARCWVLRKQALLSSGRVPGASVSRPVLPCGWMPAGRGWFRLLLENCIVDASIFCNLRFNLRLYFSVVSSF